MGMNFDQARRNMVEQQVRTWEVLDPEVLEVLGTLHREDFARPRHRKLAYADMMLPLDHDQVMMKPVVEGRVLQSLDLSGDEEVLEIGTGSGYLTACLATLALRVTSVDFFQSFADAAERKLGALGLSNVSFESGDVLGEWSPGRAFDAVVVTASAAEVPGRFQEWVKPGGRLFAVRGHSPVMEAVVMTRLDAEQWSTESLFETDLPRLIGAEDRETFEF
ncbi:MAG: protein-L-isoaspartate O-methyltransferase [Xanthomonadales bacterium]|nr:protein-L-isoaspartate O-methyltransferase [Xanthomonadales bacterium]